MPREAFPCAAPLHTRTRGVRHDLAACHRLRGGPRTSRHERRGDLVGVQSRARTTRPQRQAESRVQGGAGRAGQPRGA